MVRSLPVRPGAEGPVDAAQETAGTAQQGVAQQTVAAVAIAAGVGLHLGQQTTVRLVPAEVGTGRYFVRTDLPGEVPIAAEVGRVVQTQLSTELGVGAHTVRTVEHLLASLVSLGVDNVRIEIDGPEVPLLDGSAKEWTETILAVGLRSQSAVRRVRPPLSEPVSVQAKDALVTALPSDELRFSYGIDFDLAAIGNQWHSWAMPLSGDAVAPGERFEAAIAPARTFGLAHQIDYLRGQGLIKGGSLDNALVCSAEGWVNPPLRFENEPARHKLLDLIGDLSLLGDIPRAHYIAYKASHALHVELARLLCDRCPL
ncbi:MAG: UDP-3-O-acyl-N-acetylglucosamine deacetylase [Cyanobacteria bacterium J06607_13]